MMGGAMMLSFTASKCKNGGAAGPKSGVDMQGGMAVIKKDLGGMRVRINVLGGMAVICRLLKGTPNFTKLLTGTVPHWYPKTGSFIIYVEDATLGLFK
jgi:hypothetical protein